MRKFYIGFVVALVLLAGGFVQADAEENKIFPQKVEADRNYDGTIDRIEYYQNGFIARVEEDTNFDGKADDFTDYIEGKPVKTERDTNGDGRVDAWISF
ncbi:MAG: hypothetical protein A3G33_01535 [Omnitrophica bacterium RIFCSPLOWO2_12_FULL_44_17]|uniref:EF-hand domain-containing protein n=1 Tax=Candidatus Danuiimicrobium aquiferis TaxID=1801832 RepID=A0A1G1KV42_9BACT|nr:MAG: hypothetical protein A3B72_00765 [Omnitrophica bacterium RIFCSPHIGHO2_02_FULL_45_28]OGW96796.1 MAG: hypothetical protein A3G33_01535 [Omnitrophica bacterium RIFCSPLOWO2_12_FULL_44_17]OGX03797.1 MAG: hypothetical protein A3J12_09420 [Omnitrophica bacterium RIFCSPLOWO2_02_FULL_44_11]